MTTYLACMGTRPEIIKMASLHRVLKARGDRVQVLHTGQHEAMAHVLYRFFDMGPDLQIRLQRSSPRLGNLTADLLDNVDRVVSETRPDVVLVQGDTSSALAGAMAGYYNDRPVAHIEAGLRTGNLKALFSKEVMVGFLNGLAWALVVGTVSGLWFTDAMLGVVIAAAMMINLVTAGCLC